jgi:hypothetical protein
LAVLDEDGDVPTIKSIENSLHINNNVDKNSLRHKVASFMGKNISGRDTVQFLKLQKALLTNG